MNDVLSGALKEMAQGSFYTALGAVLLAAALKVAPEQRTADQRTKIAKQFKTTPTAIMTAIRPMIGKA